VSERYYRKWRGIVQERNMQDFFSGSELKTFFIPVDASDKIDKGRTDDLALAGHIIPGKVLFTRAIPPPGGYGQAVKFESAVDELIKSERVAGRNRQQQSKLRVLLSVKNITGTDARPDSFLSKSTKHETIDYRCADKSWQVERRH
jgi:hypothetical protein